MTKKLTHILWVALITALFLASCTDPNKDKPWDPNQPYDPLNPPKKVNRTMIMYMVADNNLYRDLVGDINEMEQGFVDGTDGTLLVYLYPLAAKANEKPSQGYPRIYRIRHDEDPKVINSTILKEFTQDERHDPLDPQTMRSTLELAMQMAPSDSYALGFSSHSTGWVPASTKLSMPQEQIVSWANYGQQLPATRTFGQIYTHKTQMEIHDLPQALPQGVKFDFIFFDACLMGGVEVAYQLRNSTTQMLFSSTEVLATGFPYVKMIPKVFEPQANVVGMAEEFANYYGAQTGKYQSGTVSVVETAKLQALAMATKKVTESDPTPKINAQQIFYFTGNLISPLWFDLEDYMAKVWPNSPALPEFRQALSDAVTYQWASSNFFDIPIRSHCGMTSFVPQERYNDIAPIYIQKYDWSKDSGLDKVAANTLGL